MARLGLPDAVVEKLFRASLPRPYKHLTHAGPRFHLSGNNPDLNRSILWDGKVLGRTQSLAAVEGKCQDQSCFILGTGPSIKELDLTRLRGQAVIGVNGAIQVMQTHGLSPSHYTVTDIDFFQNRFEMIREVILSGADCFFSFGGFRVIAETDPSLLESPNLYLSEVVNRPYGQPRRTQANFLSWARNEPNLVLPTPPRDDDSRVGWSRDLRLGVFCSRTILYRALQTAAFLGYKRLYVLGMDLNYQGPQARAYDEGTQARPTKIARDFEPYILPAFQVLKQVMETEDKFQVYNLSDKSRMPEEVLPRMRFEDALASQKQ